MQYFFVCVLLLLLRTHVDRSMQRAKNLNRERDKAAGYESCARPLYQYDMQLCLGRRQVKGQPDDSII